MKKRWVIADEGVTEHPKMTRFVLAAEMLQLRESMSRVKRSEDKEQLCLNPLEGMKKSVGRPLIKISIETEDTHAMIHFICR